MQNEESVVLSSEKNNQGEGISESNSSTAKCFASTYKTSLSTLIKALLLNTV